MNNSRQLNLLQTPSDSTKHRFDKFLSGGKSHPIKRLREDSGTHSVDAADVLKYVDTTKKVTGLEMQITKLKEENKKLVIEKDTVAQEKKMSALREGEEEKNKRDRLFNQRNSLFEKNKELEEELEAVSEEYQTFQKYLSQKHDKLLTEVSLLKTQTLEVTEALESEKRKSNYTKQQLNTKHASDITERDYKILQLENSVKSQKETIDILTGDVESMRDKVGKYGELQKSEYNLKMELDSLKDKALFANIFPKKILKSNQVEEENVRLLRDLQNMRAEKEMTELLKIKLEDTQKEVSGLKAKLSDYHQYKSQHDSLLNELEEWRTMKSELNLTCPTSIKSSLLHHQKESLQYTSTIETYKSELNKAQTEVAELRATNTQLDTRVQDDSALVSELRGKLSSAEIKCAEHREEANSCKKLLETYQTSNEEERQHLPKRAGVKILHMRHNPYQDKLDKELARLSEENSKLRGQLETAANADVLKEYEHCQQRLNETELTLKKTRTIYQAKVKEFKESICDLFGYSISCPADNQYSLLSIYAENQHDNILFYRDKGMQLMENKYTKVLDMQSHISKLTQHKSIPLFLSDVTSDLFHRQTIM